MKRSETLPKLQRRRVSVVVTVLNEEATIKRLLDSLINQTLKPSEIIIVDGGSTDRTVATIKKYKVTLLAKTGNRSVGRNYGVSKSKGQIIAFTDAGCVPEPNWLEKLIEPFADPKVQVVSGYYKGLPQNIFQKCLVPYVLVMPDQIRGEFYPSTRSMAMRKRVGFFDEKLSHNEDYAFAVALKKKGVEFYFAPNAVVGWLPRKNLRQAAWMFLRFAAGDAQTGLLRTKVKLLFFRYYVFFFLIFISVYFWLLAIPYLIWSIFKNFKYVKDIRAIYWLPTLQITADIMVLFGTIVGLLSRIK